MTIKRFLQALVILGVVGLLSVSCSKEYSVDPDLMSADSSSMEGNSWSFVMQYNGKDTALNGTFSEKYYDDTTYASITDGKSIYALAGESVGDIDHTFQLALYFTQSANMNSLPIVLSSNDPSSFTGAIIIDPDDKGYAGGLLFKDFVGALAVTSGSDDTVRISNTHLTVTINQYYSANKLAIGTFEGVLQIGDGTLFDIKQGKFKVNLP